MRESRSRRGPRAHRAGKRGGFTLVELIIVVVVIGILAAVAVPRLDTSAMRADAAARAVRGAAQVAQRTAVMRQFDVILSVDEDRSAIRVVEDRNNNATVDPDERATWVHLEDGARLAVPPATVGVAAGAPAALVLSQPRTIGGLPSIIFRRNGATSSDAEIFVQGHRQRESDFRAVTIVRATGRADWYRRESTWKRAGA